ncbi:lytic transglycosylase domain-containing protein [Dichotomicrobium thermohalophilum]|uniref:Soluble lytic murein transglycosylase n=1 Tax=Dichotomicrobium thermohalophilum TaxID=933063 RepID=A0A397Q1R4_9HYPH|nr:lytic transglycosylase domain-containing protein [Dichotomicrobium thermohalophilum]RIA55326.1 soluble lytic murein transglycosylase [Dichotomicrobium thermohalophilum]
MGTGSHNGAGGERFGLVLAGVAVVGALTGLVVGLAPWSENDQRIAAVAPEPAAKPAPAEQPELAARPEPAPAKPASPPPEAGDFAVRPLPEAPVTGEAEQTAQDGVPTPPVRKHPPPRTEPQIASLARPTVSPSAPPWAHDLQQRPRGLDRKAIDDRLDQIERIRISESDLELLKEAIRLFYKDRLDAGKPLIERIEDDTARRMARWYYLRSSKGHADLAEFVAFRRDHPMWPSKKVLRRNAELSALLKEPPAQDVFAFFADEPPRTGTGKAALGAAYLATGDKEKGTSLIREAWRRHALNEDAQEAIRERYDNLLRKADHKARADWLLAQDDRDLTDDARRLKKELDKLDQKSLDARVAEVRRSRRAGGLLTQLDEKVKTEPEVLLSRVRWLRRHGNDEKAWRLMKMAPEDPEALVDPNEWWQERRVQTRTALNAGKPEIAYEIASRHGGATGDDLHEAEFLAGWIALRFLNKPEAAREHFAASRTGADLPADFARSDYWAGRAALQLGDFEMAEQFFARAAQHFHVYYGQLAGLALGEKAEPIRFRKPARPTREDMERFAARDVVRALPIAQQADFDSFLSLFIYEMARDLESPGEMTLAAELARRIAPPNVLVRFGKVALNRGFPVEAYAYPTDIPEFEMLSGARPVERALMLALARQESEFNPEARSYAGARGLLQLMPGTARMMARINNVRYRLSSLNDPVYNAKLGSAYMRRLLNRFDDSYIMMLAGYNAGPGRVNQWIELFGDPRRPGVDPVDWVERIPFTQTRVYVHKIMESLQVYRAVLAQGEAGDVTLATDLHRGRTGSPPAPIYAGTAMN